MLLFAVFMLMNIIPGQAVQAAPAVAWEDNYLEQTTPGSDVQQRQKYIANLNFYLENVDEIIGAQTINAIKQFQTHYSLTADGIMVAETANDPLNQNGPDYSTTVTPSRGAISRTSLLRASQDLDCLARTVHGEARGESFEGQVAVAAVVLNRLDSGQFGKSISEVVFQRNAFTAVRDGQYYLQPNDSSYAAAVAAVNGWDPTNGAVYYWNPVAATSRWVRTRTIITSIGNHVFAI